MKENNSYIKINLGGLIVVAVLLTATVMGGNWWNKVRIQEKLVKITASAERIYGVRKEEIIKTIKKSGNSASENALLTQINAPEKGIQTIAFLFKEGNGYRLAAQYGSGRVLNAEETEKVKTVLNENKSVSTDVDIFARQQWEKEKLFAFTPIKDADGTLLGYLVLSVNKKQNL